MSEEIRVPRKGIHSLRSIKSLCLHALSSVPLISKKLNRRKKMDINFMIIIIFFGFIGLIFYYLGKAAGKNIQFAFAGNEKNVFYAFESGKTLNQTLTKIEEIVRENAILKKELKNKEATMGKINKVSFFILDALHNLRSKEEHESNNFKDDGLAQIRNFLSKGRYLIHEKNLENTENYEQLLNFIKNDLTELGFNRKLYTEEKFNRLWLNYSKLEIEL